MHCSSFTSFSLLILKYGAQAQTVAPTQRLSYKIRRFSVSQENLCISWNPYLHYRVHKSPTVVCIPNCMNTILILPSCALKIHFNIIFPFTPRSSKWSLAFMFSTKTMYTFFFFPTRSTCHARLILLDLIIRTIFLEQYTSLCSFLQPRVISSFLGPSIFLHALFWNIFNLCFSFNVRNQV